jgi:hypothetical protein
VLAVAGVPYLSMHRLSPAPRLAQVCLEAPSRSPSEEVIAEEWGPGVLSRVVSRKLLMGMRLQLPTAQGASPETPVLWDKIPSLPET